MRSTSASRRSSLDHGALAVELEDQGDGAVGLGLVELGVHEVDEHPVEEAADLHDSYVAVVVLRQERRPAG